MVKNMTEGKPLKLILGFALPMLLGNVFQQLYNLTDAAIIGRFVGSDSLAAVGTSGIVFMLMLAAIGGMTNGAGIVIAQYFGAKQYDKMKSAITSLIYIIVFSTLFFSIIGTIIAKPLLTLLQTPPEIMDEACSYIKIVFIFSIVTTTYNGSATILRSEGNSRAPLYALIVASLCNIALDLLFVVKFKLGVRGVAYATVISQMVSATICISYIYFNRQELGITGLNLKLDTSMLASVFKMGLPTSLQSSLIILGNMSVQGLVNSFGTPTMAAYTASTKIDTIALQVVISLAISLSVFTGQNIAVGNIQRIKQGLKDTLKVMLPACIIIAVLILIFNKQLLLLFLDPAEASASIDIGSKYLSIIGIAYIIAGIMQSFLNVIKGAGDVNFSMIAGLAELSGRIFFAYVLAYFFGSTGIWIATPISWGMGCCATLIRYASGKWKTKSVVKVANCN